MKSLIVFTALLSAAFAAPQAAGPRRLRRAPSRVSRKTLTPQNVAAGAVEGLNNEYNVEYSSNWAGAVLIGSGFTEVTGTITVPTPSVPSGGNSRTEYAASAWVGIDGDTCTTAILQTGVDLYVEGSETGYDAWYEVRLAPC